MADDKDKSDKSDKKDKPETKASDTLRNDKAFKPLHEAFPKGKFAWLGSKTYVIGFVILIVILASWGWNGGGMKMPDILKVPVTPEDEPISTKTTSDLGGHSMYVGAEWSEPMKVGMDQNLTVLPVDRFVYWGVAADGDTDPSHVYHLPPLYLGNPTLKLRDGARILQVRVEDKDGNPLLENKTVAFYYELKPKRRLY